MRFSFTKDPSNSLRDPFLHKITRPKKRKLFPAGWNNMSPREDRTELREEVVKTAKTCRVRDCSVLQIPLSHP